MISRITGHAVVQRKDHVHLTLELDISRAEAKNVMRFLNFGSNDISAIVVQGNRTLTLIHIDRQEEVYE